MITHQRDKCRNFIVANSTWQAHCFIPDDNLDVPGTLISLVDNNHAYASLLI